MLVGYTSGKKGGIDTYVAVILGLDGMEGLFVFAH